MQNWRPPSLSNLSKVSKHRKKDYWKKSTVVFHILVCLGSLFHNGDEGPEISGEVFHVSPVTARRDILIWQQSCYITTRNLFISNNTALLDTLTLDPLWSDMNSQHMDSQSMKYGTKNINHRRVLCVGFWRAMNRPCYQINFNFSSLVYRIYTEVHLSCTGLIFANS